MAADFSMQAIISQQIQNLYRQVKSLSCSNTTEILKTGAMVDKMLMQYRDNVELLILQTHLEILNSREQRARAIASRVWELGGNISLVFEKMYLDDLINLGMLEMSMLLIKPHFENLEEDIEVFPLEMIKFALITGSIPLLKKIIAVAPAEPLYQALNQFADSYRLNNYEEHFKNIHLGKADAEPFISPEGVVKNADKVHGEQHKGIQVQQPGQKPAAALCPGCG